MDPTGKPVILGSFEIEITLDYKLFKPFSDNNKAKTFPVSSLDEPLAAVNEMHQDLIEEEKKFFTWVQLGYTDGNVRQKKGVKNDRGKEKRGYCLLY